MIKSFLKSLFYKEQNPPLPEHAVYVPGTQLTYDPQLIDRLINDHQELIKLYSLCAKSFTKGNHAQLSKRLSEFKRQFTSHLLLENVRFYTYMRYLLNNDKEKTTRIRHYQSEMGTIGKVVFSFLETYTQPDVTYDSEFKAAFDAIGSALTTRIDAEENDLYRLYRPPSSIEQKS